MTSDASYTRRLEKNRVALVVIDLQERFRDIIHGMAAVATASDRLIRFCQHLEIPIVVTEHYPRGLGVTFPELRRLFDPFKPVEKISFSCCGNGEFNNTIDQLKRDQIILCGIESHVCVYQTAFDLLNKGKQVAIAVDAISSRSAANREVGLQRMATLGTHNMCVEMIMFEILRRAKTDDFKLVANILRE